MNTEREKEYFSDTDSGDSDIRVSFDQGSSFEDNLQEHHVMLMIKQTQDGELEPQEDCLELFGANDRPISFVCILGDVYNRYGQVANQICEATGSGFMSESVRGNEGIWVYTKPFFNAKSNNVIYYILAKESELEPLSPKMLSFVMLMSGSIIYVTNSDLHSKSLNTMRSLAQLGEYIIFASKSEEHILPELMPSFNLVLVGPKQGDDTKDVLETYLNSTQDLTKKAVKSLLVRRQTYFVECNNDKKFSEEAVARIGNLKRKILVNTDCKTIKGHKIESGSIGAVLIETLAENINTKGVVPINQVWEEINDISAKNAYQSAITHYIEMYDENFNKQEPKEEELYEVLKEMRQQTVEEFDRNVSREYSESERKKLMQFIQEHEKSIVEANLRACEIHNLKILKKVTAKAQQNAKNGRYKQKENFDADLDDLVHKYKKESKGPKKEVLLNQFLQQFKSSFEKVIGSNMDNSGSANFPQVHYDSSENLAFSLGNPQASQIAATKNKQLQHQIEQLKLKLEAKELKNSLVLKKQEQRLELQNEKIRQQMASMNTQQRPKTQKCCLLF